jgi:hypothetical protein
MRSIDNNVNDAAMFILSTTDNNEKMNFLRSYFLNYNTNFEVNISDSVTNPNSSNGIYLMTIINRTYEYQND